MRKSSFNISPDQLEDDKVLALQLEALIPYIDELITLAQEGITGHQAANILDGTVEGRLPTWNAGTSQWDEFAGLAFSAANDTTDLIVPDNDDFRIKDNTYEIRMDIVNSRLRFTGSNIRLSGLFNDYLLISSGVIQSGMGAGVMSLGTTGTAFLNAYFSGQVFTNDLRISESAYFQQEIQTLATVLNFDYVVDFRNGNKQKVVVSNNIGLGFTPAGVGNYQVQLVNGGNYTITLNTNIKWAQGITPTWTTDGIDMICLYYDGSQWYGSAGLGFA